MKHYYTIITIALFVVFASSCEKEKENTEVTVKKTTYTIVNNTVFEDTYNIGLDGSMYDVIVFEYKGDDIVNQRNEDLIPSGSSKLFTTITSQSIEKVKVSFKLLPDTAPAGIENGRFYTLSYFLLVTDGTITITIDDNTMISSSLKSVGAAKELSTLLTMSLKQ